MVDESAILRDIGGKSLQLLSSIYWIQPDILTSGQHCSHGNCYPGHGHRNPQMREGSVLGSKVCSLPCPSHYSAPPRPTSQTLAPFAHMETMGRLTTEPYLAHYEVQRHGKWEETFWRLS